MLNANILEGSCDSPYTRSLGNSSALGHRVIAGFSSDGKYLVFTGTGFLVDTHFPYLYARGVGPPGDLGIEDVQTAAFSKNATLVALGTGAGKVHIIERESKREIQAFTLDERVHALRFTDDGKFLETLSGSSPLRLRRHYVLPRHNLIKEACSRAVTLDLPEAVWREYFGNAQYPTEKACSEYNRPGPVSPK
jgi:hypothetical protein